MYHPFRFLVFLGFLFTLILHCHADPGSGCSKTSPLLHFESDIEMVQHQLRGLIKVLDDCSFRVSEFDMLPGSDVHWWGAAGPDFANLTSGFVIADDKLNKTYKNESFVVRLRSNLTWDRIGVLAVWDIPTASDFGHVVMGDPRNGSGNIAVSPDLAPSPAMEPNSSTVRNRTGGVPTMFENCKVLSPNYRVRWTLSAD